MKNKGHTLVEVMVCVLIVSLILLIIPLSMWTGSNLDFWLTHFKGRPVHVPFILDLLITIIGNGVVIAGNIVSEICKYLV